MPSVQDSQVAKPRHSAAWQPPVMKKISAPARPSASSPNRPTSSGLRGGSASGSLPDLKVKGCNRSADSCPRTRRPLHLHREVPNTLLCNCSTVHCIACFTLSACSSPSFQGTEAAAELPLKVTCHGRKASGNGAPRSPVSSLQLTGLPKARTLLRGLWSGSDRRPQCLREDLVPAASEQCGNHVPCASCRTTVFCQALFQAEASTPRSSKGSLI